MSGLTRVRPALTSCGTRLRRRRLARSIAGSAVSPELRGARMAGRTLVRGGWVVGYQDGGHTLIRDGVVVVEGDRVAHVGASYDGPVDRTIDATGKLVS